MADIRIRKTIISERPTACCAFLLALVYISGSSAFASRSRLDDTGFPSRARVARRAYLVALQHEIVAGVDAIVGVASSVPAHSAS